MYINKVTIQGFRNFKNADINLAEKSLIIGANDVGKSNFLYALRLILDKNLPESQLEPKQSDFYAYEDINELEIIVEFNEVKEDCILSKMREHVSDEGKLLLAYKATRDKNSKKTLYKLLAGRDLNSLEEIQSRHYLRVLNLKFISSRRDLFDYIRREKRGLLQEAKDKRTNEENEKDILSLNEIERNIEGINQSIKNLSFVNMATGSINETLSSLSVTLNGEEVIFDAVSTDPSIFIDELRLISEINGKSVIIGGDGRNNQIHLALWAARNQLATSDTIEPSEVSIFCIEEPEAHLHPHQQRKLAQYLSDTLSGQVIITTHSPQIACQIPPKSIIRFFNLGNGTLAAGNGVNPFTEEAFIDFGYRLNIIPAEAFFANVVFLVEGVSEELFYKSLAKQITIDLDKLNISVLIVDGIGFKPYISLFKSLMIPFVIRTDNDIFQIQNKKTFRLAGIQRAIDLYTSSGNTNPDLDQAILDIKDSLSDLSMPISQEIIKKSGDLIKLLEKTNIFLSDKDLENDLYKAIPDIVSKYFENKLSEDEIIKKMQSQKAGFMFNFLQTSSSELGKLSNSVLAKPLILCKNIVASIYGINP